VSGRLRMAADVGGSFTDLVVDDGADLRAFKAPTTPADPALGVLDALAVAAPGRHDGRRGRDGGAAGAHHQRAGHAAVMTSTPSSWTMTTSS
jgi:N-methylhydantoinase A